MDLIAPPSKFGAMENWGLMTFAESYLLYDPATTVDRAKKYLLTVIAHELSHQFFGNLITLNYWDEVSTTFGIRPICLFVQVLRVL